MKVVIPTHNRNQLLERTLNSLSECELPAAYSGTIVVENGGQFGAQAIVEQMDKRLDATYLYYPEGNKSSALNAVLETLDETLVVFFDDDVRLSAGCLEAYAEAARLQPDCFYGGPVEAEYETTPPRWLIDLLPYSASGWDLGQSDIEITEPRLLGANWAAFAKDLREVGGFNPKNGPSASLSATGQETDMQRRLLSQSTKGQYISKAKVWHFVPAERCSEDWLIDRQYRNGLQRGMGLVTGKVAYLRILKLVFLEAGVAFFQLILRQLFAGHGAKLKAKIKWEKVKGTLAGAIANYSTTNR